jgi:hypothetical protein
VKSRIRALGLIAAVGLFTGGDLLACGDKFLMAGRGTRYQRPKTARAASILIYADSASGLAAGVQDAKVQSALKHEGHRSTTVSTFEQLAAILQGGRFDVVLAASGDAASVEKLLVGAPDAAVVVALDSSPKEGSLLRAIDKAVEKRDRNARKSQPRT